MSIIYKYSFRLGAVVLMGLLFSSCKKFIELGPPPTQTVLEDVFKTDATATSAVLAMYSGGGSINSVAANFTTYAGMSADDVQYNTVSTQFDELETNSINPLTNALNENGIWAAAYQFVKNANNAVAGLTASTTLTPAVKDQLMGEAKFFRAFAYFYLVNFYGDVPMPLKSDASFEESAMLPRTPAADVWKQIFNDLKDAQNLLPAAYTGNNRTRLNKWAATALLARAYLYNKEYANAEAQASQIIAANTYSLPSLANAFINTSNEIILQSGTTTGVSLFGPIYLAVAGSIPTYSMYDTLYKSFETGDLRKTNWAGVTNVSGTNYYFVNKYKLRTATAGNEYNVVLRFGEVLLIRGEARAQQNNLTGARADVDSVRSRAGLPALSALLTQPQLLLAIEQERKVELFGEWGHRWFDLKRTNRATAVIGGQKPASWQPTDVLYPIPENQRLANTNLTQNLGYF
jgi:starch-binding outer membrane protein, SusD/RagB family